MPMNVRISLAPAFAGVTIMGMALPYICAHPLANLVLPLLRTIPVQQLAPVTGVADDDDGRGWWVVFGNKAACLRQCCRGNLLFR